MLMLGLSATLWSDTEYPDHHFVSGVSDHPAGRRIDTSGDVTTQLEQFNAYRHQSSRLASRQLQFANHWLWSVNFYLLFFRFPGQLPLPHQGHSLTVKLLTLTQVDKRHICGGVERERRNGRFDPPRLRP